MRQMLVLAVVVAVVTTVGSTAWACGGHEARAADCLERLFGDSHVTGMADHSLTVSAGGESMTAHGADDTMVERLTEFLTAHGVTQTSADPCASGSDAQNLFDDQNLAG
ncbi:MAG: hypothetical protein HZA54_09810 [Planctomycetes bacterium]|nr:hypothetical protein [Planctomycetota bacterium]